MKNAREAVLDSTAMCIISNLGRQKAQALHTEFIRFQPTEFAEKLVSWRLAKGQGVWGKIYFNYPKRGEEHFNPIALRQAKIACEFWPRPSWPF